MRVIDAAEDYVDIVTSLEILPVTNFHEAIFKALRPVDHRAEG